MTDLERHWEDLPVGEAPVADILRAGRREAARRSPGRRLRRSLLAVGGLGVVTGAFVAGVLVAAPQAGTPGPGGAGGTAGPGDVAAGGGDAVPAAFHGALQAADDCDGLLESYTSRARDLVSRWGWGGGPELYYRDGVVFPSEEMDQGLRRVPAPTSSKAPSTAKSVSGETGTNVQEAGVDEPDVVKTDGSVLVRLREAELSVYDVTRPAVHLLGRLDLGDLHHGEVLLVGKRVVVLGDDGTPAGDDGVVRQTRVVTVGIADPTDPVVQHTVDYDAHLQSARLHGDDVRLVLSSGLPDLGFATRGRDRAERNRDLVDGTTLDDWLPQTVVDGGEPRQLLDCSRVAVPRADLAPTTTSVVGFDAARPQDVSSLGLAGETGIAYESADHLYLATQQQGWWGCLDRCFGTVVADDAADAGTTHVYDFALDGAGATYVGDGEVEGRLADRWSVDEHDGVLRLAVEPTSETGDFTSIVTMRAEGDRLVEVGRLDGIGTGQELQSVRWFDGLALAVTFRRVDPFYAIDLTDETRPTKLGELEVPGFSDYLHPLGERRVLGLGQGPQAGRGTGGQAGLFDVTDLTDPQRLSAVGFGRGSRTLAGQDPRQLTWLPAERTVLTVVRQGRAGYVAAIRLDRGRLDDTLTKVEYGSDVDQVRTVPLPDGRVVLVTGEAVAFFDVGS